MKKPIAKLEQEGPNPKLQAAIDAALDSLTDEKVQVPPDIALKILNTAISWEKVKHAIMEDSDSGGYDPDED